MGAKKKSNKKKSSSAGKKATKPDGSGAVTGELEALSLAPPPTQPTQLNDVSSLLFDGKNDRIIPFSLPFIGPISIAERGGDADEDGASNVVVHGRGLVTTRDVAAGECLFVTPAIVSADAVEVRRRYLQECTNDEDIVVDLEEITEDHLVEKVLSLGEILDDEEIQPKENVARAKRLLGALTAQMKSEEVPKLEKTEEWMGILIANQTYSSDKLDRDAIISIIRRNAFGPDYHSYDKIEECWREKADSEGCYNRLLGVYPLSAMINHSCSPNAVRVFGSIPPRSTKAAPTPSDDIDNIQGGEVMIVHASANIPKGTEIMWSYLPPSTPFTPRREMLRSTYGFTCKCDRCMNEEVALCIPEFKELWAVADGFSSLGETLVSLIPSIEKILHTKRLSNEQQRFMRVGYSKLYLEFFNAALSHEETEDSIRNLLHVGTQLHFSFASCNNASTEHLSIIHMCYDLSAQLRARAVKGNSPEAKSKTMSQVRFWTEQLKKAHMVRYGYLGEDLEIVREAMKHSKLVLRNQEGWYLAKNRFI